MIDYDKLKLRVFDCNGKKLFVIPSTQIFNPDCEEIVRITDDLQEIINQLLQYMRTII